MKKARNILYIVLTAALLFGLSVLPVHGAKAIDHGVTVILTADNVVYQPGSQAELTIAITNRNEYPISAGTTVTLPEGMTPLDSPLTDSRIISAGETAVLRMNARIYGQTLEEAEGSNVVLIAALIVTVLLVIVLIIRYHKAKESVGAILLCLLCLGQANILSAAELPAVTVEETVSLSGDDRVISARVEISPAESTES